MKGFDLSSPRSHVMSTKQTILSPFTKEYHVLMRKSNLPYPLCWESCTQKAKKEYRERLHTEEGEILPLFAIVGYTSSSHGGTTSSSAPQMPQLSHLHKDVTNSILTLTRLRSRKGRLNIKRKANGGITHTFLGLLAKIKGEVIQIACYWVSQVSLMCCTTT
ncbi:hypothetical protein Lal_00004031 [Lupinus albus]|nr:hypothetical protein Lal_00004031 [Lupinus albus]